MTVQICPRLLSEGACTSDDCDFRHDVHLCQTCRIVCMSAGALQSHLNGKKHRIRVRAQACPYPSFCNLCQVLLGSPWNYPQHIQGRTHLASLEGRKENNESRSDESVSEVLLVPPGLVNCQVCDANVADRLWSNHVTGFKHRKKERFAAIQAAFDEADKDKHGITVSHGDDGVDFGFVDLDTLSTKPTKQIEITILLTTPGRIDVSDVRLSSSLAQRPRLSK